MHYCAFIVLPERPESRAHLEEMVDKAMAPHEEIYGEEDETAHHKWFDRFWSGLGGDAWVCVVDYHV